MLSTRKLLIHISIQTVTVYVVLSIPARTPIDALVAIQLVFPKLPCACHSLQFAERTREVDSSFVDSEKTNPGESSGPLAPVIAEPIYLDAGCDRASQPT